MKKAELLFLVAILALSLFACTNKWGQTCGRCRGSGTITVVIENSDEEHTIHCPACGGSGITPNPM